MVRFGCLALLLQLSILVCCDQNKRTAEVRDASDTSSVAVADGQPMLEYRAGDEVQVNSHGTWYDATILEAKAKDQYKVRYDGQSGEQWVGADRLRRRVLYCPPCDVGTERADADCPCPLVIRTPFQDVKLPTGVVLVREEVTQRYPANESYVWVLARGSVEELMTHFGGLPGAVKKDEGTVELEPGNSRGALTVSVAPLRPIPQRSSTRGPVLEKIPGGFNSWITIHYRFRRFGGPRGH